jgi:protein-tyrosine phosphatase
VIDTHCHLLPGLDDGTRSPDEARKLAAELTDTGVRAILCTPHYTRRFPTDHAEACAQLENVRTLLAEDDLPLELGLAAEVGPVTALEAPDAELERRAIASRFLLVELEPDTPAPFLSLCTDRLAGLGLTPVFGHPERCRAVQRDVRTLMLARERGALVQVVAPSLGGAWGGRVRHAAWTLVAERRADLVASDAHRPGRRREALAPVLRELSAKLGAAETRRLVEEGPARLWDGSAPGGGA